MAIYTALTIAGMDKAGDDARDKDFADQDDESRGPHRHAHGAFAFKLVGGPGVDGGIDTAPGHDKKTQCPTGS